MAADSPSSLSANTSSVPGHRTGNAPQSSAVQAADPKGAWFTFEKGASKTTGGEGWADVWRKGCFAWEYKGKRKDLDAAFRQLLNYSIALDNPPLLIVSDMDRIKVHTNWTNTVHRIHEIEIEDLPFAITKLARATAALSATTITSAAKCPRGSDFRPRSLANSGGLNNNLCRVHDGIKENTNPIIDERFHA